MKAPFELLGVSLFMAASVGTLPFAAWRRGGLPEMMPVAAAVAALSLRMIATGAWLIASSKANRSKGATPHGCALAPRYSRLSARAPCCDAPPTA